MTKTILVSGCTKGIGLAIVNKFAEMGFDIAGCARTKGEITQLQLDLSKQYPNQKFFFEVCDVRNKEVLKTFAHTVMEEFRQVDVLVNNAGIFIPGQIIMKRKAFLNKLWKQMLAVLTI